MSSLTATQFNWILVQWIPDEHVEFWFLLLSEVLWIEIMFKFNFITDSEDKDTENGASGWLNVWFLENSLDIQQVFFATHLLNTETEAEPESEPETINKCDECFEVIPTEEQEKGDYFAPDLVSTLNRISFGNKHKIYHLPVENIIDQLIEKYDDISCAEQHHSDLVAGVYEGKDYSWNFISWLRICL